MYLFLDTETTGLPRRKSALVRQWPRLVQIAWTAYDQAGRWLAAEAHLVRPAGFAIPATAVSIHGISTGRARREGQPVAWVIERLLRAVREHGKVLVGHNVAFDRNVIAAEMYRLDYASDAVGKEFFGRRHLCLMMASTAFCGLPGRFGKQPKYPTLAQLYWRLFGEDLRGCHNARVDVEASARCFFRLRELGVIW
jgi:DNA polymerase III epsilon subunit-like protein